jgi:hypothetical protein
MFRALEMMNSEQLKLDSHVKEGTEQRSKYNSKT